MVRSAAVAFSATLLVAGCGGRSSAREVAAGRETPSGCFVQVFFRTTIRSGREATRAEIGHVRELIAADGDVETFAFVSKRLALRRMAARHPELLPTPPANPLPPSFEVVPKASKDAASFAKTFRGTAGVEHVSVGRACG
jgi:cell division protein FtsX